MWSVEGTKDAIGRTEKLTVRCPLRKEHNPNENQSIDTWANLLADAAQTLTAA